MTAIVQSKVLGVDILQVDTVQQHALGLEIQMDDGNVYKYVRAGAAIALGDVLKVDVAEGPNDYDPQVAADIPHAGCWPSTRAAAIADNSFFWALIKGNASVKAAATVVAGTPAISTATAGTVDDTAATAANALAMASGVGAVFQTTTTGGFATVCFF
jgi:hypothetical protein